ncbi:MAG: DUF1566 domain-containing protein [Candidatus Nanopelagicales bacterium]|nr:DUF1566 domain-containing protein [Candidatus Nanopelagicales bacterium]MDZ4250575.1 DUF1566 domain-containing protein [Candidatus Nanopelagicales bacterium]
MRLRFTGIAAFGVGVALALGACSPPTDTEPLREAGGPAESACSSLRVGDTGPGGGSIFYKDMNRPAGSRCFEAAPSGWNGGGSDPSLAWGTTGKCASTSFATGTAIGDGEANTTAITSSTACDTAAKAPAAWAAKNYAGGGKSDWFLPSKDELNQLYAQEATVGGFAGGSYWSSSQASARNAWGQGFVGGALNVVSQGYAGRVRPVRAF